jgi:hypothetical protein
MNPRRHPRPSPRLPVTFLTLLAALWLGSAPVRAQRLSGEIRLRVRDSSGAAIEVTGVLHSLSTGVHRKFSTDPLGLHEFRNLPFGPYRLEVEKAGFATTVVPIEVLSALPVDKEVTLSVAGVSAEIIVSETAGTLTDPRSTSAGRYLGPDAIGSRPSSRAGRSIVDLVNAQPGWLLEANGVLHPRGSEYDVQYVIDGIPLYDNRSPAFAQLLGVDEFESLNVRTSAYPAEFGRKLGGVVELTTRRDPTPGWHGRTSLQGGSDSEFSGFSSVHYSTTRNSFGVTGEGMTTGRYLDPPVPENYTNHASGGGFSIRFDRTWSPSDSTRIYTSRRRTGFLVPNERLQQIAGQRQDRTAAETLAQASHTHVFGRGLLAQMRLMVRDTGVRLWSNALSTPIAPGQDRGFREAYAGGGIWYSRKAHEVSAGGEALFSSIHEDFSYRIVAYRLDPGNVRIFDRDLPAEFRFRSRARGRDQSAFVQDMWRHGSLTVNTGLRFDRYRLIENKTAWSPRAAVAYAFPSFGLVLRSSYDRVFQVPATENLLLASTNLVSSLGGEGSFLPLEPSHGDFLEAGFSKSLFARVRVDGTWYRRRVDNFADDSLLLNTGVTFPTAFAAASIHGYEAKVEIPAWGRFSGFASYSNMVGTGRLPVAGGLFLGDETDELRSGTGSFPISQDQRNTLRSRAQVRLHPRVWLAAAGVYNSGLPFEIEGTTNLAFIAAQYGPRILGKANFERGRVRPSASVDASLGVELMRSDRAKATLQADVFNLGDRFNVINFAGVFSGTAIERGRSFALRLSLSY